MYEVGDIIYHKDFGKGEILSAKKQGNEPVFAVKFADKARLCTSWRFVGSSTDSLRFDRKVVENIQAYVDEKGINQFQMGQRMDMTEATVNSYMRLAKNRKITAEFLYKFCKAYGLKMEDFCE